MPHTCKLCPRGSRPQTVAISPALSTASLYFSSQSSQHFLYIYGLQVHSVGICSLVNWILYAVKVKHLPKQRAWLNISGVNFLSAIHAWETRRAPLHSVIAMQSLAASPSDELSEKRLTVITIKIPFFSMSQEIPSI